MRIAYESPLRHTLIFKRDSAIICEKPLLRREVVKVLPYFEPDAVRGT